MASTSYSEASILSTFDTLVAEGILIYLPYTTVRKDTKDGYPIEFRIAPSIGTKPHTTTSALDSRFTSKQTYGPGSDMYILDPRITVAQPNSTHLLNLNPNPVDRPQYVLQTIDTHARQTAFLEIADFAAALEVLRSLTPTSEMYIIYNCTEAGGCSRWHKHMQGLLGTPPAFPLLISADPADIEKIPFAYFSAKLPAGWDSDPAEVLALYEELMVKVKRVLGLPVEVRKDVPHNLALCRGWMVVIPRRSNNVLRATANTAGMMGSPWVPAKEHLDALEGTDFAEVLKGLGVPRIE